MNDWLRRNMRARRVFVEAFVYFVFYAVYFLVRDAGRDYGWWRNGFWISLALAIPFFTALGLVLHLIGRRY